MHRRMYIPDRISELRIRRLLPRWNAEKSGGLHYPDHPLRMLRSRFGEPVVYSTNGSEGAGSISIRDASSSAADSRGRFRPAVAEDGRCGAVM